MEAIAIFIMGAGFALMAYARAKQDAQERERDGG